LVPWNDRHGGRLSAMIEHRPALDMYDNDLFQLAPDITSPR
jgi:hypothetical protein